ncbi:MAG: type II secretion system protein [Candidatus Peribacteraceae bacterium]
MMSSARLSQATERGFTLIELLIGVGIIGLLSSIVIVAINPSKQLEDAEQAGRLVSARTIEKAMTQHVIDEWSSTAFSGQGVSLNEGVANAVPICRTTASELADCLSIDALVPTYIAAVPEDDSFPSDNHTGYCMYLDSSRYRVFSVYDMPADAACGGDELLVEDAIASSEIIIDGVEVISSSASAVPVGPKDVIGG